MTRRKFGGEAESMRCCITLTRMLNIYTSEQFQRLLADNGITCSMSRAGNAWDNLAMVSFFSSLKTKRTASKTYRSRDDARAEFKAGLSQPYGVRR